MPPVNVPWTQACLSACAFAAAIAYGAPWLGLGWVYDITVNGHSFQLTAQFPLAMLAALFMGAAAGLARGSSRHPFAAPGLSFGAGAIFGSSLYLLLIWAPGGAPAGQLELLKDASRLGFTLLALALPFALPVASPPLARLGSLAFGVLLAPVLLFPHHVEAAGYADVHTTLPMLLFFLQGLTALSGTAQIGAGKGWGRSKAKAAPQEVDGVTFLRALTHRGPSRSGRPAPRPRLRFEPLRALPHGPEGPDGPAPPPPRHARAAWFNQF